METFLRKYFKEKMQEQGQRRMQVRDNTAASEVKWGNGNSLFYIPSVKSQGQPTAAMGNK